MKSLRNQAGCWKARLIFQQVEALSRRGKAGSTNPRHKRSSEQFTRLRNREKGLVEERGFDSPTPVPNPCQLDVAN
jgi:hypothetical protein